METKFYFMSKTFFFLSSGGTTFNVIGKGFIAIDNLTVGILNSEVRLLIVG